MISQYKIKKKDLEKKLRDKLKLKETINNKKNIN